MDKEKSCCYEEGNLIKYTKYRGRVFLYAYLLLVGAYIFIFSVLNISNVLLYNKYKFDLIISYGMLMFTLFIIFISIFNLIDYFSNKIFISDLFIKIKRATLGKEYIISKNCVVGKQTIITSVKGMNNSKVLLFLKNGKTISTGHLNCKTKDLNIINNMLDFKEISDRKSLKKSVENKDSMLSTLSKTVDSKRTLLLNNKINENDFKVRTNYIFPVITFSPLILLLIIASLLFTGYNHKYGKQEKIEIRGKVYDMKIEKQENDTNYMIVVLEDTTHEDYQIDVSKDIYYQYNINEGIMISAIRGSLGIIYDIKFEN